MLPIKTVLHPTGFSERSDYAFQLACSLARDYGARLIVMHVVQPPIVVYGNGVVTAPLRIETATLHQKLAQRQSPDAKVRVEHLIAEGDPPEEILKVANESKADVIVLGTHGWTGWSRLLMGSVAEQVVRRATCPVLTVKIPIGSSSRVAPPETCKIEATASVG